MGTGQDALTQGAIDALNNALDNLGDETSSNPKIIVSWSNIKNRPIANNNNTIGINGDLYVRNQAEIGCGHIADGSLSNYLRLGLQSGVDNVWITGLGRMGIGTSSPTAVLQTTGNVLLNNASIGTISAYGGNWTAFSHSNRLSAGNYALIQNNDGQTMLNASTGQTIELRINNASTAFIESERIGILGSKTLEFGTDQTKQADDGKIRFRGWSDFLDIVGTRTAGESGARCVKVYDVLQVNSTNYSSDSNLKIKMQPLGRMLDKLDKWEGKTFEWKNDKTGKNRYKEGKQVGLLAQDVQLICPEAVSEMNGGLCYDQTALNGVLVQLCKDLKDEIDELKKKIKN
jgi:hypothetical protein